ncbi:MAG: hypothetical protein LBF81_02250 [Prevotellaceae bacterium]|jgi:hypothetical protein|nr:hypothetical protein [Prevotellaceae bacterium]
MKKNLSLLLSAGVVILACFLYEIMQHKEMYGTILLCLLMLYALVVNYPKQRISTLFPTLLIVVYFGLSASQWGSYNLFVNERTWATLLLLTGWVLAGFFIGFFALKWKVVRENYRLIALTLLAFALAIVSLEGYRPFQFFAVGVIYLLAPYIAERYISQKKYTAWIIVAPFVALFGTSALVNGAVSVYPVVIISIVSAGMYYLLRLPVKPLAITIAVIYTAFLAYGWYAGMNIYIRWVECMPAGALFQN